MDRFPLRESQWLALGEWVGRDGARKVARLSGVSVEELDAVVAARVAPTVHDRSRLIPALIRAGYAQGRGDPFAPDQTEYRYGLGDPGRRERRALRGWSLPNERD